jgi:hypothetical protein
VSTGADQAEPLPPDCDEPSVPVVESPVTAVACEPAPEVAAPE